MTRNQPRTTWPVDLSHMRPEDAAEWVVARFGDGAMPIQPERIAGRLGVEVRAARPNECGTVIGGANGKPWILIDVNESEHHQRFAIAHALGHVVLRHDHPHLESPISLAPLAPDPRDRAANQFAASMLIPTEKLRWCVTSGWMRNIDQILKALWVPKNLLLFRYRQMRGGR